MLRDVVEFLVCPRCRQRLDLTGDVLRCARGHAFDVARQGYVNLLAGERPAGTADTSEMVAAREAFLAAGHYAALEEALATRARALLAAGGVVVDAGAGTGHYLRQVLDRAENAVGIALDVSKPALRRAAAAHPRIGAVAWDVWRPWPLRSGVAALVVNVLSPRNGAEFRRVLRPDGALLVVTPGTGHLRELESALEVLSVDPRKEERLYEALAPHFTVEERAEVVAELLLGHGEVRALVGMSPSAHHLDSGKIERAVRRLPEPVSVTASFLVAVYRPLTS